MGYVQTIEPQTAAEVMEAARRVEARRRAMLRPIKVALTAVKQIAPVAILKPKGREWLVPFDAHVRTFQFAQSQPKLQRIAALEKQIKELQQIGIEKPKVLVLPIIKEMAEYYGVSHVDLASDRRQKAIALVRQKIMWVIKQVSPLSYPAIGRHFGNRDHTTVLHAVRKIDGMIKANHPGVAEIHRWIKVVERQQIAREFKA
jgi:hypothetical protein